MIDCIFCSIVSGSAPSRTVYEDDHIKAFFDVNPASIWHTLIVPKQHCNNLYDVPEKDLEKMIVLAKKLAILYKKIFGFENVNIMNSSWKLAWQDTFHFHIHVIPRYDWDEINFIYTPNMSIIENFDSILEKIKKELL